MALATLQHTHARLNVAGFQETKQCSIYYERNWHNKCRRRGWAQETPRVLECSSLNKLK